MTTETTQTESKPTFQIEADGLICSSVVHNNQTVRVVLGQAFSRIAQLPSQGRGLLTEDLLLACSDWLESEGYTVDLDMSD